MKDKCKFAFDSREVNKIWRLFLVKYKTMLCKIIMNMGSTRKKISLIAHKTLSSRWSTVGQFHKNLIVSFKQLVQLGTKNCSTENNNENKMTAVQGRD